jgi:hypothetical protein
MHSVISTRKSDVYRQKCDLFTQSVILHAECDFTRRVWFPHTRMKFWHVCVWIWHSRVWLRYARVWLIHRMRFHTQIVIKVQFPPVECDFHTPECNFDTYACEYDTHECVYETLECDLCTESAIPHAECDFYTQGVFCTCIVISIGLNVITAPTSVTSTRLSLISTRIVSFPHTECDLTRRVWFSHTRVSLTRIRVNITLSREISTNTNVIITHTSVISTRRVRFTHAECDFTHRVWFPHTRE